MNRLTIEENAVEMFAEWLGNEERCQATIDKYISDIRAFARWLGDRALDKETVRQWKSCQISEGLRPATVNSKLAALNGFFRFLGREDCRMKFLKIQRQLFREKEKELSRDEYRRLVDCAYGLGKKRLALILETMGATGIRVSELHYITMSAAETGRAEVALKGKIRTVIIPSQLCRKLLKYARKNKIASGEIFLTRSGKSISRKQIWAEMKALCKKAGVAADKVFPHNLRHLFARVFYKASKDISKLADVLGHSSIETTRIYLLSSGAEHVRQIERLGLIQ